MKVKQKTKRERFETVASQRVQIILERLETLSKCANTNNYEYSESDVKKMFSTIKEKLRNVEGMYNQKSSKRKNTFSFNK